MAGWKERAVDPKHENTRLEDLSIKQQAFVIEYLSNGWNGTQAAISAGYGKNKASSSAAAGTLLDNPKVYAAIQSELRKKCLTKDQVLARLSELAQGNVADFLQRRPDGTICDSVDLEAFKRKGHFVRKYKAAGEKTPEEIELHDSLAALLHVGKAHALFTDRTETSGRDGGPVEIVVKVQESEMP